MLYQLSYEATHWERGQLLRSYLPVRRNIGLFANESVRQRMNTIPQRRISVRQRLYASYVPVKSKFQHPPRATTRAFEFLKNFRSYSPVTGPKSCSNALPPPGKLPDYCFNFSVAVHVNMVY